MPFRLALLASGRGSNLRALRRAEQDAAWPAQLVGVFSDKPDCGAIAFAREQGLAHWARRPREFADRAAYDESLFNAVAAVQPDLIVCAGYMRLISEAAVRRFEGRMINIHPSLLPRFPGLDTHARALAAGESEHGASVHVVTPDLDAGPVLAQARVPVRPDDTPASLAARVLGREHALLVQSVRLVAEGRARLSSGAIAFDGAPLSAPLRLNADDRLEPAR